jgi:hypothetical protein
MNTDRNYARCKACDTPFYPVWREEQGCFEDLCYKCLPIAMYASISDDEYLDEDSVTVQEVVSSQERHIPDSLWELDDYLSDSMGDLGLLDKL